MAVDLALALVGLWLLFHVCHTELRRRESEIALENHRAQVDVARERARGLQQQLDERDSRGVAAREGRESESLLAGLSDDPSPAEIAAVVSPSPSPFGGPPQVLEDVRSVVRQRPELATQAMRRWMASDPPAQSA